MIFPKRLYKYKAFSALTIDLLVSDKVFFADPESFNDPLDTKPSVKPDLSVHELEQTLRGMIENRITAEMQAAAKAIMYRGPKTMLHIEKQSRARAERMIVDIAYNATNPEYEEEAPGPQVGLLVHHLSTELIRAYGKGVLSLAERNSCPLMWSHYGDQHHGLCIGYDIPQDVRESLHKVQYGGSRLIEASKVEAMLNADEIARREVDSAVLLRKARDWRYEREWRLIGDRGLKDSPLELAEVTFGTRCLDSVKHSVIRALDGRGTNVKLYEMREVYGTFKLKRVPINTAELSASYPHRSLSVSEYFDKIP